MSSWRGRTLEEEKMGTKRREPATRSRRVTGTQRRRADGYNNPKYNEEEQTIAEKSDNFSVSQRIAFWSLSG